MVTQLHHRSTVPSLTLPPPPPAPPPPVPTAPRDEALIDALSLFEASLVVPSASTPSVLDVDHGALRRPAAPATRAQPVGPRVRTAPLADEDEARDWTRLLASAGASVIAVMATAGAVALAL